MTRAKMPDPTVKYFSPRARAAMESIEGYPISVFSAPAGFGKTTLLREYAKRAKLRVLWYTLYPSEPAVLWEEICKRLLDTDSFDIWAAGGRPAETKAMYAFAEAVGRNLQKLGETVLILDCYEESSDPGLKELLLLVVQEQPRLHIVIAGRTMVWGHEAIPVLKGVAALHTAELFVQEPGDIESYFQKCGMQISEEQSEQLYQLGGGWFPMLYNAVLRREVPEGELRQQEVWKLAATAVGGVVGERELKALLSAAPETHITREMLSFLAGCEFTEAEISTLLYRNTFLFFDHTAGGYRIHTLLHQWLMDRLGRLTEKERAEIYLRLGCWHEKQGASYEAMKYYDLAGEYDRLLQVMMSFGWIGSQHEEKEAFVKYFCDCPKKTLLRYPGALTRFLGRFYYFGEDSLAQKALTLFQESLDGSGLSEEEKKELLYDCELSKSIGAFNDISRMIEHFKAALKYSRGLPHKRTMDFPVTYGSTVILPLFYKGGDMQQTLQDISRWVDVGKQISRDSFMSLDLLAKAESEYFACRYDQADIILQRVLHLCSGRQQWSTEICARHLSGKLGLATGDVNRMDRELRRLQEITKLYFRNDSRMTQAVELCECFFNIKLGREKQAAPWLSGEKFLQRQFLPSALPTIYANYGALLLAMKEYAQLIALEEELLSKSSRCASRIHDIYNGVHIAAAYEALGFLEEATERVERMMALALPYGIYMPFVEDHMYIPGVMNRIAEKHPEYAEQLRPYITAYGRAIQRLYVSYNGPRSKRLAKREYEMASMAATGATNEEIAAAFGVSVNTVKAALKVVFKKLDISSRRELPEILREISAT